MPRCRPVASWTNGNCPGRAARSGVRTLDSVSLRLFDTATRKQRDFVPLRAGAASMYVCGATVQGLPHIGHVRSGLNYDVLRRWLTHRGLRRHCSSATSPTSTTRSSSRRPRRGGRGGSGRPPTSARSVAAYDALGCLPPSIEPRATGHVPQMIELMQRLIACGHAYAAGGDVYFSVRSFPEYGALSGQQARRGRPGRVRRARQARPARLHAVEGGQAGRAVLAHAVGPRPPRLAPGVLGDGHHVPGAGVRHPRRRHRPDLPAPRERAGPVARGG